MKATLITIALLTVAAPSAPASTVGAVHTHEQCLRKHRLLTETVWELTHFYAPMTVDAWFDLRYPRGGRRVPLGCELHGQTPDNHEEIHT